MDVIGTINLSQSSEIIFYVGKYKGTAFASIRKFIKSQKYTGPTKRGIMLNKRQLQIIYEILQRLQIDSETIQDQELIKIPLNDSRFIYVGINFFEGQYGLDIRQYLKTEKYAGPSKKGVRIPVEYFSDVVGYCQKMLDVLQNHTNQESFIKENSDTRKNKTNNVEGVPDEYQRYF